ncbi:MAG: DUF6390 family protein [Candidatus Limnocylindrales bacterium]
MTLAPTQPLGGTTRFVRYAFMPNRLQYCGGDDNRTILEYAVADVREPPLVGMLKKFTGALPYLALIARGNGIADPFDERVVEAYWLGNELLEKVEARALYDDLRARYGNKLSPKVMDRVAAKAPAGARPHHSFHVLDVWRQADREKAEVLAMVDSCRISWGTVAAMDSGELIVQRPPVVLRDGRLELDPPRSERVTRMLEGQGFVADAKVGDIVSLHWSWACEVITAAQQRTLERYTRFHLALASQTL